MSYKRYKRSRISMTPSIVFLNIAIILVILGLIYAIYRLLSSEFTSAAQPANATQANQFVQTTHSTRTPAETSPPPETALSMTKAATTVHTTHEASTPAVTEAEVSSAGSRVSEKETIQGSEESESVAEFSDGFFKNDLFVGDSISTGFYLYGYLDKSNVFAKVGLNPSTALTESIDGFTLAQKVTTMRPENIYIMLGSNGLTYLSNDTMAKNIAIIAESLTEYSPTSTVYILTIPPVTVTRENGYPQNMNDVNDYNARLLTVADELMISYIDICSILKNENGYFDEKYAENDGLHLKGPAYKKVLAFVEESVSN